LPPVEMLITASVDCFTRGRKRMKSSALGEGLPSASLRAWRCRIAAPASAAPIAASAIWSAVTGRCGDMEGVWIEPVGAQVMMALLVLRMASRLSESGVADIFAVQIFLDAVVRAFLAHARHLHPAERRMGGGDEPGIDADHAGLQLARDMADRRRIGRAEI